MIRIAVLTSSRADFGIYLPLLMELKNDPFFHLSLVAFGPHLSAIHGKTINEIHQQDFKVDYTIDSLIEDDSALGIAASMAQTSSKFAYFWNEHRDDFDLVFCLGDRFEMFSAVSAGIPFNIRFAHIHGGEKTLGAIDNIFRHSISLSSTFHFVSCEEHGKRVSEIIGSEKGIFNSGSLSLCNLESLKFLNKNEFLDRFNINLDHPTILVTLHPETVLPDSNKENVKSLSELLLKLIKYQVIITLPNADTNNSVIRETFLKLPMTTGNRIKCFESLGIQGYFTAMKYCSFLIGNSSSGIIEAASFGKWVINLGKRQEGRMQSGNVLNSPFDSEHIISLLRRIEKSPDYKGNNIYFKEGSAKYICSILKNLL